MTDEYSITKTSAPLGCANRHFSGSADECRKWITASENDAGGRAEQLRQSLETLLGFVEADAGNGCLSGDYEAAIYKARQGLRGES